MTRRITLCLALFVYLQMAMGQAWTDSVSINIRTSAANPSQVNNTKFRIWLPEAAQGIKGIVLVSARGVGFNNGADGSGIYGRGEAFKFALNPFVRQVAMQKSLALVCFQGQGDAGLLTDFNPQIGHADSLQKAIALLAARTGRPELIFVPYIAFGHSLGGVFSEYLALWNPDKVAGTILYQTNAGSSAPSWTSPFNPDMNLRKVPVLYTNGELEGPDINNNSLPYFGPNTFSKLLSLRQNQVPVHPLFFRSGSHSTLFPHEAGMMARFIAEVVDFRIPPSSTPAMAPVVLIDPNLATGYLGGLSAYNSFDPTVQAYAAPDAASRFWLFNESYAQAWSQFHTPKLSFSLSRPGPYCANDTVSVRYQINPALFHGQQAMVRLDMSSIRGDFDSYSFNYRICGSKSIQSANQLTGSFVARIPDNIQRVQPIGNGTPPRYRFRLVFDHATEVSAASGESVINFCSGPEFNLYTWLQNGGVPTRFCTGSNDTITLVVARSSTFTLNADNVLTVQLSDSLGSFANARSLQQLFSTIPGSGSAPSVNIRVGLPADVLPGSGYRLRVVSSSPASNGSSNGSDIEFLRPAGSPVPLLRDNNQRLYAPFAQKYQWYKNGTLLAGEVFQYLSGLTGIDLQQDSISCIFWNGNCSQVAFNARTVGLGLVDRQPTLPIKIFPNPADHGIWIEGLEEGHYQLSIYHASGQMLVKQAYHHANNRPALAGHRLPAGIYTLRIQGSKATYTARVQVTN